MDNLIKCYFTEFIGTLLLVLIGCGSATFAGSQIGWLGIGLVFGLTLMVLIYIFSPISGCHLNPMVTMGLALTNRFPKKNVLGYIVFQLLGAALGGFFLYILTQGASFINIQEGLAITGMGEFSPSGCSVFTGLLAEFIGFFTFLFVILSATTKNVPTGFAPIAIGGILTALIIFLIPITNASLNIARSFGVALFHRGAFTQLPLFVLTHFLAAFLATITWNFLNSSLKQEKD